MARLVCAAGRFLTGSLLPAAPNGGQLAGAAHAPARKTAHSSGSCLGFLGSGGSTFRELKVILGCLLNSWAVWAT